MCTKLGMIDAEGWVQVRPESRALIESIQKLLTQDKVDYTHFWRTLSHFINGASIDTIRDLFIDRPAIDAWLLQYSEQSNQQNSRLQANLMLKTNPKYVLRNYLGEQAISAAKLKDYSVVETLLKLLQAPYNEHPSFEAYAALPPDWAADIQISCSS